MEVKEFIIGDVLSRKLFGSQVVLLVLFGCLGKKDLINLLFIVPDPKGSIQGPLDISAHPLSSNIFVPCLADRFMFAHNTEDAL
jgi:hypothetical protein